jgi:hypothetical protein
MNTVYDLTFSHPLAMKLDRPLDELTESFPGTENVGRLGDVLHQDFFRD